MEPGQWGMKQNFTRNWPESYTRYSKEDSSSFEGKGSHTEYQIAKLSMLKKMSQWLIIFLAHYSISFDPNHVTQSLLESQDVIVS